MDPTTTLTHKFLLTESTAISNGLINLLIVPKNNVLIWADNHPNLLLILCSCALLGVRPIIISPDIYDDDHLKQILDETKARIMFVHGSGEGKEKYNTLSRVIPQVLNIREKYDLDPMYNKDYEIQWVLSFNNTFMDEYPGIMPIRASQAYFVFSDLLNQITPKLNDNDHFISSYSLGANNKLIYNEGYTQSNFIDAALNSVKNIKMTPNETVCQGLNLCTMNGVLTTMGCYLRDSLVLFPSSNTINKFLFYAEIQKTNYFILDNSMHNQLNSEQIKDMILNGEHLNKYFKSENILNID